MEVDADPPSVGFSALEAGVTTAAAQSERKALALSVQEVEQPGVGCPGRSVPQVLTSGHSKRVCDFRL